MPKENDLEGQQDQGGKHGGQKGMPKPEPRPKTEIPGRDRVDVATPTPLSEGRHSALPPSPGPC
jgi:hypothetical protein